jgi:hypothetical protein
MLHQCLLQTPVDCVVNLLQPACLLDDMKSLALLQVPYSGFGIAARGLAMHFTVRIVRTGAFLAVVMPNARSPRCFADRFAPVPEGTWDYIIAGAKSLRGSGGCNDLILRCADLAVL